MRLLQEPIWFPHGGQDRSIPASGLEAGPTVRDVVLVLRSQIVTLNGDSPAGETACPITMLKSAQAEGLCHGFLLPRFRAKDGAEGFVGPQIDKSVWTLPSVAEALLQPSQHPVLTGGIAGSSGTGGEARGFSMVECVYFEIVTRATMLSALSAITMLLPSRVVIMLRTTPPPDGMAQVWNFSVLGSKRTSVFGLHVRLDVPDGVLRAR